jgi:hypothetical protein
MCRGKGPNYIASKKLSYELFYFNIDNMDMHIFICVFILTTVASAMNSLIDLNNIEKQQAS